MTWTLNRASTRNGKSPGEAASGVRMARAGTGWNLVQTSNGWTLTCIVEADLLCSFDSDFKFRSVSSIFAVAGCTAATPITSVTPITAVNGRSIKRKLCGHFNCKLLESRYLSAYPVLTHLILQLLRPASRLEKLWRQAASHESLPSLSLCI